MQSNELLYDRWNADCYNKKLRTHGLNSLHERITSWLYDFEKHLVIHASSFFFPCFIPIYLFIYLMQIGELYDAKVKNVTDDMLYLVIGAGLRALCPSIHFADVRIRNPKVEKKKKKVISYV